MAIYALGDLVPRISSSAYVHPDAVVIGNVDIDDEASIWPSAVLRGDYGHIHIGAQTSIQDGTIVHCTQTEPTIVGSQCTVGHNAHLEGCTIGELCLIGSASVVMNGAVIGRGALVAAGAVVLGRSVVEASTIVAGIPAKPRGAVPEGFLVQSRARVDHYVSNSRSYKKKLRRID